MGHLISDAEESALTHHGKWAARFLQPFVPARVAWLVEHHVIAKRYLCTVDRAYAEGLSLGSLRSWRRQGGALDHATRLALEREPWLPDVLAIRRWDDAAKEPRPAAPALSAYRDLLEGCFGRQSWEPWPPDHRAGDRGSRRPPDRFIVASPRGHSAATCLR